MGGDRTDVDDGAGGAGVCSAETGDVDDDLSGTTKDCFSGTALTPIDLAYTLLSAKLLDFVDGFSPLLILPLTIIFCS